MGDYFEKRIPHGLLRKPYFCEARAKIRPAAFPKAAGEGQGARRPALRAARSSPPNERGRGCDGSTACFPPAACRSRMNAGGGCFDGTHSESKARRIWVCDFFGVPKAFFKGYGPLWRLGRIDCKRIECAFLPRDKADAVLRSASPVKGAAHSRVGTAPFRNSFFGRMCRYLSKFACDGGALRFISRRRRAPYVPSAVVRRFWCAALRRRGARDGGVSMQKYARRQNRRAYTYFPFSARKIRRTRICG